MIELGFGEGIGASLKIANLNKEGETQSQVIYMNLYLDIGDISDMDKGMSSRKNILETLFGDFPGVPEDMWRATEYALSILNEARKTLEPVRVWVCESDPAEMCGLFFVCYLLKDCKVPLSVVNIPSHVEKDNTFLSYHSTGEVAAVDLSGFMKYEESLSNLKRKINASNWCELVHGNARLRATINGRIMGVPEDFYDFALRANFQEDEFMIVKLIGSTLCTVPGVGDRWLYMRVKAMNKAGELIEITPPSSEHPYSWALKRNLNVD
jgi:hypothetical protein